MKTSLIIPVHNDTQNLQRLLAQAGSLGCFEQAIVIDDGSEPPLSVAMIRPKDAAENWLMLHRNPAPLGPGPARNQALEFVKTSHFLYVDSDDLLADDMPQILRDLNGLDFDFCMFKHNDSRMEHGQMPPDEALWQSVNLGQGPLIFLDEAAKAKLAQTANYPWNKIYNSAFLRSSGARCSDILVHEDVALHWQSFIFANTILASPRIAVQHFVDADSQRLTNLRGPERLELFQVLPGLFRQVYAESRPELLYSFLRFISGLLYWIEYNVTPDLRRNIRRQTGVFWKLVLSELPLKGIKKQDPELFEHIKDQRRRGRIIRLPKLRVGKVRSK